MVDVLVRNFGHCPGDAERQALGRKLIFDYSAPDFHWPGTVSRCLGVGTVAKARPGRGLFLHASSRNPRGSDFIKLIKCINWCIIATMRISLSIAYRDHIRLPDWFAKTLENSEKQRAVSLLFRPPNYRQTRISAANERLLADNLREDQREQQNA